MQPMRSLLAGAVVGALLLTGAGPASAQPVPMTDGPDEALHRELADLHRRVDLDLDRHFRDAYTIWEHFVATYMEDEIPVPVTGRAARKNEDDIREYLSEMKKARFAHRNNATVAGRIDDWAFRMSKWASLNARLSIQRLWEIKMLESQHAFGLLARDAEDQYQAVRSRVVARLEEIDAEHDEETARVAARTAYLESIRDSETERALTLTARARAIATDLAQWRVRLAAKSWRWKHYMEEAGTSAAVDAFRIMIYDNFGLALAARKADPLDPIFGTDLPDQGRLDWVALLEQRADALGLRTLVAPDTTEPLTLDLTSAFLPVEALDPTGLTVAPLPSVGTPEIRAAKRIAKTVEALQASEQREAEAMFRLVAALDTAPTPGDLVDRTKDHLVQLRLAVTLAGRPVRAAAQLAATTAEHDALAAALAEAERADPQDEDTIANLKADLASTASLRDRLQDGLEKARADLLSNDDLHEAWKVHQSTHTTLRETWADLGHARLTGMLAAWPRALPDFKGDPAAILLDLEDAVGGVTRLLRAAAPAADVTEKDADAAARTIRLEDAHQLRLARTLQAARIQAARLVLRARDGQGDGGVSSDGSDTRSAEALDESLRRAIARFEIKLAKGQDLGSATDTDTVVPAGSVRRFATRLGALQREGAPIRQDTALLEIDPKATLDHAALLDVLAAGLERGLPVAGAAALVFDDALIAAETERLTALREREGSDMGSDDILVRALATRPFLRTPTALDR